MYMLYYSCVGQVKVLEYVSSDMWNYRSRHEPFVVYELFIKIVTYLIRVFVCVSI